MVGGVLHVGEVGAGPLDLDVGQPPGPQGEGQGLVGLQPEPVGAGLDLEVDAGGPLGGGGGGQGVQGGQGGHHHPTARRQGRLGGGAVRGERSEEIKRHVHLGRAQGLRLEG